MATNEVDAVTPQVSGDLNYLASVTDVIGSKTFLHLSLLA